MRIGTPGIWLYYFGGSFHSNSFVLRTNESALNKFRINGRKQAIKSRARFRKYEYLGNMPVKSFVLQRDLRDRKSIESNITEKGVGSPLHAKN